MNEENKKNHIIENIENWILKLIEKQNQIELAELIYGNKLPIPKDTPEERKDRLVKILTESGESLSLDSISAVVTLEHLNEGNTALMNLIKKNKIQARYVGDTDKLFKINCFIFERVK